MIRREKAHWALFWLMTTLISFALPGVTSVHAVNNDWRVPQNIDYKKNPPSISTSVIPNILIILDNSSSMGFNAYGDNTNNFDLVENDHYDGEYLDAVQTSYNTSVVADFDDLEEDGSGQVHDDGSDGLNLGEELVAVRFQQVAIPTGATIVSAYVAFTAEAGSATGTCTFSITAEDTADADPVDVDTNGALSGLPQTAASVDWSEDDWSENSAYQTPDLADLITTLIEKNDWAENNSMRLFISGDGSCSRIAESQRTGGTPAELTVTYIAPDQKTETRYYGYFNTEWFYEYDTSQNLYKLKYKKEGDFDFANNQWHVTNRSGGTDTVTAAKVASEDLWDGNWLNWLTMRRSDILRKVLIGGDTHGERDGTGTQILYGQGKTSVDHPHMKNGVNLYTKAFNGDLALVTPYSGYYEYQAGTYTTDETDTFDATFQVNGDTFYIHVLKERALEEDEFRFYNGGWNLSGVVQEVGDRARWGNMWYQRGKYGENADGGWLENPIGTDITTLVDALEKSEIRTGTPLAETLYTAANYFSQAEATSVLSTYMPYTNPHTGAETSVTTGGYGDPFYKLDTEDWDNDGDKTDYIAIPCIKSFVLLLTDGNSTRDFRVPDAVKDADGDGGNTSDDCDEYENDPADTCPSPYGGTDFLDDVAYFAHTTDLRPDDTNLPGDQTLSLHTVYTFDDNASARTLIQEACKNGAFEDADGDNTPNLTEEWDSDEDGIPDTYYEASDGEVLEKALRKAFEKMMQDTSSATATAVASNSRSGEGAMYQSMFYPRFEDKQTNKVVDWVGQVYSLLLDSYGNMREDTDGDGALNMVEDYILDFHTDENGNPVVDKYQDADGDGYTDGATDVLKAADAALNEIKYLWSSHEWLNETVTDPITQRTSYDAADENRRYILTFADANQNMVDEGGELKAFVAGNPDWTTLTSEDDYYAYIHTFDNPFEDAPTCQGQVLALTRRVINFIRGQDQDRDTTTVSGVTLDAFRPRQADFDGDGSEETLRLGDVVNSTPTLVSRPMEKFHLLYTDESYLPFVRVHQNRRHVLYVGANDGMLHAFNGGFYDSENKKYGTLPLDDNGDEDTSFANHPLGAELWGYVPFNLLPHLYWLTKTDYEHVFYMDLPPRVFDAKIYSGSDYNENHPTHPNGWATILVAGMRFGGGTIAADMDKTDGAYDATIDKKLTSAYVILDITDPENPPVLLAEITLPHLGYTTCYPGVISNRNGSNNEWYLVFGSGPASESAISGDVGPNNTALEEGISEQQARIYALDLTALTGSAPSVNLRTDEDSAILTAYSGTDSTYHLALLEDAGTVSSPITVDWDLDADTDAAYFGTSFIQSSQWKGKLRRIVINSSADWDADSVMLDLSSLAQPIMAAPTAGSDEGGNRWIFFGTGRFMSVYDKVSSTQQAFYGVKEPYDENNVFTYSTVSYDSLYDSTDEEIVEGDFTQFHSLVQAIQDDAAGGWRMDFIDPGERNIGPAVLLGGTLVFTTYYPSTDICDVDGAWSRLYALNYLTGTSYFEHAFALIQKGEDEVIIEKAIKLGSGMCSPPAVQIKRGSAAALRNQDGQGNTISTDLDVPLPLHDWRGAWLPDIEVCGQE